MMETAGNTAALFAAAGLLMSGAAIAQEPPAEGPKPGAQQAGTKEDPIWLEEIVITADRVPVQLYDTPASVSVIDAETINRKMISTPRDLIRHEPGVSVGSQPARGGSTNYVIRGIGDNRVLLQVDGLRIPDMTSSATGLGTYTRDFIDLDSVKQVEIVRGPGSALYGSDAIGGTVAYLTKDPSDYLAEVGKDWYLGAKVGFDSADMSLTETTTLAGRAGEWEAMLLYTRRDGEETEINSADRDSNPQDIAGNNFLGKVVWDGSWGLFRLTGEHREKSVETDILSEVNGASVFRSKGDDTSTRDRVSLDWETQVDGRFADSIKATAYWTQVEKQDLHTQLRGAGGTPTRWRYSDFGFTQSIVGAQVQLDAERKWLGWDHLISYGASFDVTSTERPRNRTETDLGGNPVTVDGEVFPNKNFPDTETYRGAVFVQDIAQLGALRLIPAVRLDYYHLDPNADWMFDNGSAAGTEVAAQTHWSVSPKFGATYDVSEEYRLFGQYAHGFRSPPYDNANYGWDNTGHGYVIVPNPDLKPETSDGFEAGLRGRFAGGSGFQVSGFYNIYQDFIDSRLFKTENNISYYRYDNLSNVTIWGFEAKGEWRFHPEWSLFGALAYAHGTDDDTGKAIDSVDPLTVLGGLRYDDTDGWGAEIIAKHVWAKDRVSNEAYFKAPSYTVVDTLAHYKVNEHLTVNAGVLNLLDESYFNSQDVTAISETNQNLELYRAPGRTFTLGLSTKW